MPVNTHHIRAAFLHLNLLMVLIALPLPGYTQQDTTYSGFTDTLQMNEVVISAKTAVRIHGDTTSYRVDSFITSPTATTEDVLKRLPGVEVGRDGKITIEGKPVNKLFINGKEYFADDLKTVIQNLPAEILEKIQVADYYDERSQFTGVKDNASEKVVNLQFKKKYSGGLYGRGAAGYGTQDRYQGGIFTNYIGADGLRLTGIGSANNTGIADVGNSGDDNLNNTSWSAPGVRTTQKLNLNFAADINKKFSINGSYHIDHNTNTLYKNSFRTTYLPSDSLLLQQQDDEQQGNRLSQSVNLRSKYQFTEKTILSSYLSGSLGRQSTTSSGTDRTFDNDVSDTAFLRTTEREQDGSNNSVQLNNVFMKGFAKKGRSLVVTARVAYNSSVTATENTNRNIYYDPVTSNTVSNKAEEQGATVNTHAGLQFTEPLGEHSSLSVEYNHSHTSSSNGRDVSTTNNGTYTIDTVQSRDYENANTEHNAGLTYQYFTKALSAGAGLELQPYSRRSNQVQGNAGDVHQEGINYFPRMYMRYRFSNSAHLNMNYNGSIRPPSINQVQTVPDYTDSLNIFIGNPALRPELSNNISVRFSNNDIKTGRNTWVQLGVRWVNQKIVNQTELTNSRRVTTPVNADGTYQLNGSARVTTPVFYKELKTILGISANLNNNVIIVNNVLQDIKSYMVSPTAGLRYYPDKWYEGNVYYTWTVNKVSSTAQANNVLYTHDLVHEGSFTFAGNFRMSYYLSLISKKGLAQDFQQDFFLVNAMADKTFDKPKGLSLRLQAFDVFNNYPTVQRNISDNYYEDISFNRIGSYFMFSIIYRFNSFPEKGRGEEE